MSDTQENKAAATEEPPADHDYFLNWVVTLAEDGVSMSVILTVGGNLIAGKVISGREYFEEIARMIKTSPEQPELGEALQQTLAQFKNLYPSLAVDEEAASDVPELRIRNFIHLRDARIFDGVSKAPIPANEGLLWRGRLDSVDGYSFGVLTKTDADN